MTLRPREGTQEAVEASWISDIDPTDHDVEWAFVDESSEDPPTWVAGTWKADVTLARSRYTAVTISPTIGKTGSGMTVTLAPDTTYLMLVRVDTGTERPERDVGTIRLE